jgi:hypothetical protein
VPNDDRLYVETLLKLYLSLPETPSRTSRYDRELATTLCERKVLWKRLKPPFSWHRPAAYFAIPPWLRFRASLNFAF